VLETKNARAVSTDGINWRIQIQSEIYHTPWQELAIPSNYDRYFMYGVWSKTDELAKTPVHPTLYQEHVEQSAQDLVELLTTLHEQVPFTARDDYECWLLDAKTYRPLVLIDSATGDEQPEFARVPNWYPCEHNDNSFTTTAFLARQQNVANSVHAKDMLSSIIKDQVGTKPTAVWVKRDHAGTGAGKIVAVNRKNSKLENNLLATDEFPALGIQTTREDSGQQQIIDDYISWLSPVLLTLQHLSRDKRTQFEQAAQKRPFAVEKHYRLYPEICDKALLKKILVEAAIRKVSGHKTESQYN